MSQDLADEQSYAPGTAVSVISSGSSRLGKVFWASDLHIIPDEHSTAVQALEQLENYGHRSTGTVMQALFGDQQPNAIQLTDPYLPPFPFRTQGSSVRSSPEAYQHDKSQHTSASPSPTGHWSNNARSARHWEDDATWVEPDGVRRRWWSSPGQQQELPLLFEHGIRQCNEGGLPDGFTAGFEDVSPSAAGSGRRELMDGLWERPSNGAATPGRSTRVGQDHPGAACGCMRCMCVGQLSLCMCA